MKSQGDAGAARSAKGLTLDLSSGHDLLCCQLGILTLPLSLPLPQLTYTCARALSLKIKKILNKEIKVEKLRHKGAK